MKHGIIAIDKPEGISSARVVARVKRALGAKKVGHTGTLDPFATGLILCTINKGTRISQFFLKGHKKYLARVCLGRETDTCDLTGKTVFLAPCEIMERLTKDNVKQIISSFIGVQEQLPPLYSALKHKGQPLYKLARQGKSVQKPPRTITIFDLKIKDINLPYFDIEVFCSAGTYIRSLALDIGRKIGCGGYLSKLCRIESSDFKLEHGIVLSEFESLDKEIAQKRIISLSECLKFMPHLVADNSIAKKIRFGQKLSVKQIGNPRAEPCQPIQIVDNNYDLLAIVQLDANRYDYNYTCVFMS
jgi:tRNA pseudouridine55 synthase